MHLTVIDTYPHVTCIRTSQRTLFNPVHQAFDYCWYETGINCASDNTVADNKLAAPLQRYFLRITHIHLKFLITEFICIRSRHTFIIWLNNQVHFSKLAGTSRLFLMSVIGTRCLCYCLPVRYFWLFKHDRQLIIVFNPPFQCTQMELTLPGKDCLFQFFRLHHFPCRIFFMHTGKYGTEFLRIAFCHRTDRT